jgi:type II secretory pathway pseudopilin PulG
MIATRARKPSRGMTVVAVLVCLIIVTLISGAVLKVSVAHRELARSQERRLQAEWLAESGAQRAMARLARDREFPGETWSVSDHDLGRSERGPTGTSPANAETAAARITIKVERVPASASRRRVHIQADYPLDAPRRSRHTKEIMIDLEPSQAGAAP